MEVTFLLIIIIIIIILLLLLLLFLILNTIKIKFGQILLYLITIIFNMFVAQCWRLEA